jgi:signal transduction histidine kinase/ActR/RegA family two-component response regulator
VEYRLRLPSGEYRWLVTKGRAQYDRAGKVLRLAGITMNIGDRKLAEATRDSLEQQVREAQKMEAIGTLAGGIAHDFNNILGAILGNVALARLDLSAGHAALTRLEQIAISGARARSLVEQILAFSRHDPPTLKPQLLGAIVHETAALLRATLPATVRLTVVTPDEPLRVRGDATQLEQVLLNLCTNAWHALPAGAGSIEVRLDSLNVGPTADAGAAVLAPPAPALATGRYAHLSVVDDGCGMDAATRARIFEPFFTTKPAGQGTGLGLSVVHGIVTSHGGTITVSSRPGAGCRFDLYIPQLEVSAVMAGPGPDSDAKLLVRGQGQHVLYVDDDEVMLLMVEHLLLNLGYLATCLADPRAAIATVRTRADEFDVVVTDLNMPQMSGLDAAKALHDIDPKLPVVITSGFISEQLRVDAQLVGVVALMRKEHTLEELGAMVELALAVRRQAAGPG